MITNIKSFHLVFLTVMVGLMACKKTEYSFGDIKTPANLALTAVVEGADASNPNGNGSGMVAITASAVNALSYKIDFGDGTSQILSSGTVNYKYTKTGIFDYTITVNAIGTGGATSTISKKITVLVSFEVPADILLALTGGSSKSWKLDPASGANSITVGTDANPTRDYAGGPLADCQIDDVYTFTADGKITYNANGATFNGGNIAPNYNCGDNRSYANQAFTFSAVEGGAAGLLTIKLPSAPPARFIGTTDVPSDNIYRIIEINSDKMILRAGSGAAGIFQFKFIAL